MKKYLLSVGLLFASLICHASFNDGITAYNAGDYQTALKEWQAVVEQKPTVSGDFEWRTHNAKDMTDAQYGLGILYWQGKGVAQNYHEAKKWLELAANSGDGMAQFKLAYLYLKGLEGQVNAAEAVKWFEKSAQQGNANAQYILGLLYFSGESAIPANQQLAKKWLSAAAQQGESSAKALLAKMNAAVNQTLTKQKPLAPIIPPPVVSSSQPTPFVTNATQAIDTATVVSAVQADDYYAIQLLASANQHDTVKFTENWHEQFNPLTTIQKTKNHQRVFVVVYGNYSSMTEAKQAIANLPTDLKKNKPWAVKMRGNSLAP